MMLKLTGWKYERGWEGEERRGRLGIGMDGGSSERAAGRGGGGERSEGGGSRREGCE